MKSDQTRIVIVGAGFGGIALGVALKRAGLNEFTILERAPALGGVWRDNCYPGAACDVPSRLYSYSFAQDYRWSSRFGPQAEILDYMNRVAGDYGITGHIRFDTEVVGATFDRDTGRWNVALAGGGTMAVRILVSAVGLFNRPGMPEIPGIEDFAGPLFHSARWDRDVDLAGKHVAVIGTGASAIQFVPAIAADVARLHVFQRSPQYVFPKGDPGGPVPASRAARKLARLRVFLNFEQRIRRRASRRLTAKGEAGFRAFLAAKIPDAELRRKLTPAYPLGCKRVLQSDDWYDALLRTNVELVSDAVTAIGPDFVRTVDGQDRRVDAVICGTGFTPTDFLTPMKLRGLDGRELAEAWRGGAEAYFGMSVSGFPNFFIMYGPNTNTSGSIIYMLESQARYITRCIRALTRRGASFMNVREAAQRRFNEEVQRRIGRTVLVHDSCHSYFRTATGKVTTQWPGFLFEFRLRTSRLRARDYEFG